MPPNLRGHQEKSRAALRSFWQVKKKKGSTTSGRHMDALAELLGEVVKKNGLPGAEVFHSRAQGALPGYFRASKRWDLVVTSRGRLVAAVELKSQTSKFASNFNNRVEEAVGNAYDLRTALRLGSTGRQAKVFLGWLMVAADCPESSRPVKLDRSRFAASAQFAGKSYLQRYELLCRRLVEAKLYDAAAIVTISTSAKRSGAYGELSSSTNLKQFLSGLARHVGTRFC